MILHSSFRTDHEVPRSGTLRLVPVAISTCICGDPLPKFYDYLEAMEVTLLVAKLLSCILMLSKSLM